MSNNNNNNTNNNNNNDIDTLRAELKEVKEKLLKAEGELDTVNMDILSLQSQLASEGDATARDKIQNQLNIYYNREVAFNNKITALTNQITALQNPQPQGIHIVYRSLIWYQ